MAGRGTSLFRFCRHLGRQIQGHDLARDGREGRRHDTGTTGDVEDPPVHGAADGFDETGNVRWICCCRCSRELRGLPRELSARAFQVIHICLLG